MGVKPDGEEPTLGELLDLNRWRYHREVDTLYRTGNLAIEFSDRQIFYTLTKPIPFIRKGKLIRTTYFPPNPQPQDESTLELEGPLKDMLRWLRANLAIDEDNLNGFVREL